MTTPLARAALEELTSAPENLKCSEPAMSFSVEPKTPALLYFLHAELKEAVAGEKPFFASLALETASAK